MPCPFLLFESSFTPAFRGEESGRFLEKAAPPLGQGEGKASFCEQKEAKKLY
jgi:hypothetical protein